MTAFMLFIWNAMHFMDFPLRNFSLVSRLLLYNIKITFPSPYYGNVYVISVRLERRRGT